MRTKLTENQHISFLQFFVWSDKESNTCPTVHVTRKDNEWGIPTKLNLKTIETCKHNWLLFEEAEVETGI
jgi:hypothetical protein